MKSLKSWLLDRKKNIILVGKADILDATWNVDSIWTYKSIKEYYYEHSKQLLKTRVEKEGMSIAKDSSD